MVRGDMGGDAGGVVGRDIEVVGQEADNGLQESLRRQLEARQCQRIVQVWRRGEAGFYRQRRTFHYNTKENYPVRLSASHTWHCRTRSV